MVTLIEAKQHLRIDDAHEDSLLSTYLDAAHKAVEDYTGVAFTEALPEPVKAAVLLLVADLYEHREAAVVGATRTDNPTFRLLLNPYREIDLA